MSTLRRNTFIVSEQASEPPRPARISGMDRQNLMRLKVNRIALVQELKVEHVLGALARAGIITEQDFRKIETGRTPQDRARILIDLLPTKGKDSEWYKCFREALLHPEGGKNVKHRYRPLVEFLDNTVIHRPISQAEKFSDVGSRSVTNGVSKAQYPRYDPLPQIIDKPTEPDVLKLHDGDETSHSVDTKPTGQRSDFLSVNMDFDKKPLWSGETQKPMILVKGFFHQWIPTPENFRSLIDLPSELKQLLEDIGTPEAIEQLKMEQTALHYLRRLEVLFVLARRRQLPTGFELCMCDTVQELLSHPDLFHLYLKHLNTLQESDVNITKDIAHSYAAVLEMLVSDPYSGLRQQVDDVGFRFVDMLLALDMWSLAEEVIQSIINFLMANPALENLIDEYKAHKKMMAVRNQACNFKGAQHSYFCAAQLTYQIQMVSFGRRVIFEGRLHQELSATMLEFGSIHSAHGWSRKSLHEVDPEDHESVVEVVTHAVLTHCACWQMNKAEALAVFAMQFATEKFGKYHPMYIKALSSLCHVCNEFKQDQIGLELANELLERTEKIYNCETLHLASAHRTLSKALMAVQAYHTDDSYYNHAIEAVCIARRLLPDGHALLHPYLANFALALQWKSLHCPKEVQDSTLLWAETEAKHALSIVHNNYGDISLRSAQIHTLLGQIYSKMNKQQEDMDSAPMAQSEKHLTTAVDVLKLCQPMASNYLLLAHATLGTFLSVMGQHEKAIYHLKQVIMYHESTGTYLKWVEICFQTLISLLQTPGAPYANSEEADHLQVVLSLWLRENPKHEPVDAAQLCLGPPSFRDFLDKFDSWQSAVAKIQTLKDTMKGVEVIKT